MPDLFTPHGLGYSLDLPAPGDLTLAYAQEQLRRAVAEEVTDCLCCGRVAKIYRRRFHAGMVRQLIALYLHHKQFGTVWIKALEVLTNARLGGGDYAKICWWGLLRAKETKKGDGNSAGLFKITEAGFDWIERGTAIPSHAFEWDGRPLALDSKTTLTLREAAPKDFNYRELLDGI